MRTRNISSRGKRLISLFCLLALFVAPLNAVMAKDEASSKTKKSATKKPEASVNSSDLMKAMQDSIASPLPVAKPVGEPAIMSPPVISAPDQMPPPAPPAPSAIDTPVKVGEPIKKDSFVADEKPAVPHEGGVVLYEQKGKDSEGKIVSPSSTSAEVSEPEKEAPPKPVAEKETTTPADSAPPLLTDMAEPPSNINASAPVTVPPAEQMLMPAPPTQGMPDSKYPPGFSKARPLFSPPGDNKPRKGVSGEGLFSSGVDAPMPAPAGQKQDYVPMTPPPVPVEATPYEQKKIIEPAEPSPPIISSSGNATQGSCGAINGIGTAAKPATNLCTQGTPTEVGGNGPWHWSCLGENGGAAASCSAPLQINGDCGMANGSQSATAPIGGLCNAGKASEVSGEGPWYWNCFGENGGVVAQCVAYTLVSGQCGPSHNMTTNAAPTSGLCATGKQTAVTGNGPWMWSCVGSGEGSTVNCTASLRSDGTCGSANNTGSSSAPVSGLCATGTATEVSGEGPWRWNCLGEGGGASTSCTAQPLTSGACGTAHGVGTATEPSNSLCQSGSASEITGDGPWNWTCYGENGGAMVNCMAPIKIDGICGSSHLAGSSEAPREGLCSTGKPGAVIGSGPWQWTCEGAGGGITANCVANPLINAACGTAHGVSVITPPIGDLCASGSPTTIIGSGPWMWSCQGTHGGSPVNCMAPLQVSGACGASDGVQTASAPTANLCRSGKTSGVSGSGPWTWTCQGQEGGISVSCQAPLYQSASPPVPASAAEASVPTARPADVPRETVNAGNECTPSVKRWTITCQQGGYPSNYTGVIVGETQVLCPTGVERGVWLSNSCAPATNSMPVSPSPGVLRTPPSPSLPSVLDKLPDIEPLSSKELAPPRLNTPRFRDSGSEVQAPKVSGSGLEESIGFASGSEGLDAQATNVLGMVSEYLQGDSKSIITLNAYAAVIGDNQQEARRIALARALAVRSYLMRKGITSNRIDVRAVGPASDGGSDDRVDIKVK